MPKLAPATRSPTRIKNPNRALLSELACRVDALERKMASAEVATPYAVRQTLAGICLCERIFGGISTSPRSGLIVKWRVLRKQSLKGSPDTAVNVGDPLITFITGPGRLGVPGRNARLGPQTHEALSPPLATSPRHRLARRRFGIRASIPSHRPSFSTWSTTDCQSSRSIDLSIWR